MFLVSPLIAIHSPPTNNVISKVRKIYPQTEHDRVKENIIASSLRRALGRTLSMRSDEILIAVCARSASPQLPVQEVDQRPANGIQIPHNLHQSPTRQKSHPTARYRNLFLVHS
ncbi:hypothetical protein M407DRAFT_143392 [Tulasnella calospora MUT 4182]|uniref:Uncharacterized protein n=1 Tax=Tulasnella calospora MUT 4182 TaxID=1051891 RepID=A0A0C3PXP9_9AGAM|nr:hypothetical protein M407DRAFT_143392 [Tulasnella calospora MUT 4182]